MKNNKENNDKWPSILSDEKYDVILSLTIGLPLILNFMMILFNKPMVVDNKYIQFILASIIVFITTPRKISRVIQEIKKKSLTHMMLQVFAILTVYIYSSIIVIFNIEMHYDFDCLPFILTIFGISELIESFVINKINNDVDKESKLSKLNKVLKVNESEQYLVNPEELIPGDIIIIKNGEYIPVDCILESENGSFDTSSITGEVSPYNISKSEKISSGYINIGLVVHLKVVHTLDNSIVTTLNNELKNLRSSSTKTFQVGQNVLKFILISIIFVSIFNLLIQWHLFNFEIAITRTIAIILITCPCGIGAGIPLIYSIFMKKLLNNNILVKDLSFIDKIEDIDSVAFDKTGTLTNYLHDVISLEASLLQKQLIYSVERHSSHPLAKSIVKYLQDDNISFINVENIQEISGKGISFEYDNTKYYIGSESYINSNNIYITDSNSNEDVINIYLSDDEKVLSKISLETSIIDNAKDLVYELSKKYNIYLITGDNELIATKIASKVGINNVYSKVNPLEKLNIIKKIQKKGKVVYIGDGINDSLALEKSDLSISFSNGSDIAKKSSNALLLNHNILNIYNLLDFSFKTRKTLYLAMVITILFNIITMSLAIFGIVSIEFAPFAEIISVLIIIFTSTSLLYKSNKWK